MGTKKENGVNIYNGRQSTSKESTWRNPCRKEKPRSTVEKMERRTGLNKPSAYMKRRRRRTSSMNFCTNPYVLYTSVTSYLLPYVTSQHS